MNSEHTRAVQETIVPNSAGQVEEQLREAGAAQHAKRSVSPYSLVPALTLIALQFVKDEPNLVDMVIQSIGGGNHRPGAK